MTLAWLLGRPQSREPRLLQLESLLVDKLVMTISTNRRAGVRKRPEVLLTR